MADLKTKPTDNDPRDFIEAVDHKKRREDGLVLLELFEKWSGNKPKMWGPSIIGYGDYHYKYETGREGDFFEIGFSPRKASMSIYLMTGYQRDPKLMSALGKYKTGASCIYVNKLEDIDLSVLEKLVEESIKFSRSKG